MSRKKTSLLFIILGIVTLLLIMTTYYKFIVLRDFEIIDIEEVATGEE